MTPNQQSHIQTLMANGKAAHARELLKRLIKDKNDQDAARMLAEMDEMYPETRAMKGAKAANKLVFYVLLAIVSFLVIAVLFGAIWMRIPR